MTILARGQILIFMNSCWWIIGYLITVIISHHIRNMNSRYRTLQFW